MFVRWQSRQLNKLSFKNGKPIVETHHNCVLVESFRDKAGKPQSRHVANLGGIRESDLGELWHRCMFWTSVEDALAPLKLDKADRDKLETTLAKRVGRPTELQIKTHRAEYAAFMKRGGKDGAELAAALKAARQKVRK